MSHQAGMLELIMREVEEEKPHLEQRARILVGAQIFQSIANYQNSQKEKSWKPSS